MRSIKTFCVIIPLFHISKSFAPIDLHCNYLHWNCETHETALAKYVTDSLNLLWWFCRFHDLRCLPHLHLPQERDTEGLQRPEERTLWLLFCPVVGLRPSAPDQRRPLHPPAQEAVSKIGIEDPHHSLPGLHHFQANSKQQRLKIIIIKWLKLKWNLVGSSSCDASACYPRHSVLSVYSSLRFNQTKDQPGRTKIIWQT